MVPLSTDSERRRNSNPRKVYPADQGLIRAFDTSGRANSGHALETIVFHELDRRFAEVSYVKTAEGLEADFHARYRGRGEEEIIQVCSDPGPGGRTDGPATLDRELAGLLAAGKEHPRAKKRLFVTTHDQVAIASAAAGPRSGVRIQSVYEWLLEDRG